MKKTENIIGFIVILLILVFGESFLGKQALFFRLVVGIGFGYALTRAFMGFAGSVNRPYRTGSTKLIKILALMFLATTVLTTALGFNDPMALKLWVKPINLGLILGGISFGFGMSFSSCCATGTLTDLVTGLPRAIVTLLFFGLGVFVGFPFKAASWVKTSVVSSEIGTKLYKGNGGVFMPDLFKWDGLNGYLGATILTAILVGITIFIASKYQEKRKKAGTFTGVTSEVDQEKTTVETAEETEIKLFSEATYNKLFVNPWRMEVGAAVIVAMFALLMGVTKMGWGASKIYGLWFGKMLTVFGVSADSIASFTGIKAGAFVNVFSNPVSVQNIGIVVGTLICLLLAGAFKSIFLSEIKIKPMDILFFAIGGFTMGFGTRLANGCNVGALYTPIANFSVSGWIFFAFLVVGGILGNMAAKAGKNRCVN